MGASAARFAFVAELTAFHFDMIGVVGAMAVVCLLDMTILSDDPHPAPSPAKRYAPAYERLLSKRTTEAIDLATGSGNKAPAPRPELLQYSTYYQRLNQRRDGIDIAISPSPRSSNSAS